MHFAHALLNMNNGGNIDCLLLLSLVVVHLLSLRASKPNLLMHNLITLIYSYYISLNTDKHSQAPFLLRFESRRTSFSFKRCVVFLVSCINNAEDYFNRCCLKFS